MSGSIKRTYYFNPGKPLLVMTDWSKQGIAFIIFQQYYTCDQESAPFSARKDGK